MPGSSLLFPADPRANYVAHKQEITQAIQRVLESGRYILGPEVKMFEQEFATYLGVGDAVGVANGTEALAIALRACGIGPGDVVITVSHTVVATVVAIESTGARPLLVDIDPATFTLDPNRVEDAIKRHANSHVRAIIPVHLYGNPADMLAMTEIAGRYGLYVIEDCAQAHGASLHGTKTGSWGHIGAFSFYPTKNLGALGDGGMVVSNDVELIEKIRLLRQYGWKDRYISESQGLNSRLDELQAAILRVKLKYLDQENRRRQELADLYNQLLSVTPLILPCQRDDTQHVYHQYVVRDKHRDTLKAFLRDNAVETLIHYPVPIHKQPAYQGRCIIGDPGLLATEQICQEILSLPLHQHMTHEQVRHVSNLITQWYKL